MGEGLLYDTGVHSPIYNNKLHLLVYDILHIHFKT